MATQAQARQQAKARVRDIKRTLRTVDTTLEIMERRLNKLLERETLIQTRAFNSFLGNMAEFYLRVRLLEGRVVATMALFLID